MMEESSIFVLRTEYVYRIAYPNNIFHKFLLISPLFNWIWRDNQNPIQGEPGLLKALSLKEVSMSTWHDSFLDDYEYPECFVLPETKSLGTQDKSKSLSPCRHTLEDGADATTELVSGKSSGFIGGMQ